MHEQLKRYGSVMYIVFILDEEEKSRNRHQHHTPSTSASVATDHERNTTDCLNFIAPSWLNFRFDRSAIFDCLGM
jgi:hypothetical protein